MACHAQAWDSRLTLNSSQSTKLEQVFNDLTISVRPSRDRRASETPFSHVVDALSALTMLRSRIKWLWTLA